MDLLYAYLYFVRHIIPGPQSISWLVPHILLPIALLVPRSVLSRWQNIALFIPIMVGCTIHAWSVMGSVDVPSLNGLFWAAFLLVLNDPWTDFTLLKPDVETNGKIDSVDRKRENGKQNGYVKVIQQHNTRPTCTAIPYPPTLKARIPWTFKLISSLPLDNWLISYPPHDNLQPTSPQPKPLKQFILTTTLHAALAYLTLDLTSALTTTDPYFTNSKTPLFSPLPQNVQQQKIPTSIPPYILHPTLISLQSYSLIASLLPSLAILPAILSYFSLFPAQFSPHSWPAYFGPPSTFLTRGLAGWWGGFWHQTMRWSVSGPGIAVADYLGLKRGGWARRALVLGSAFGGSGCVHMGLVPPEPVNLDREGGWSVGMVRVLVGGFFWAQVLGILVEDLFWRVLGRERWEGRAWWWLRAVGNVVWLWAWFCCCMPLLGEAGRQLGWWRHWLVPVSLVKGMRGEGWVTWEYLER